MSKTRPPKSKDEVRKLSTMLGEVFSPTGWGPIAHWDLSSDPGIKPALIRAVWRGGKPVAHVMVYDKKIRIGKAELRMGGIGSVACVKALRMEKLASSCMEEAIQAMQDDGISISFLLGIMRYYIQFGYIGCWPKYELRVSVGQLKDLKNPFRVEPFSDKDVPGIVAIYNSCAAATPSSVIRGPRQIKHVVKRMCIEYDVKSLPKDRLQVFRDKRGAGAVRAYVATKKNAVIEIGLAPGDEKACAAVLAWLRDRQIERLEKFVVLSRLCPTHPLWQYAQRFNHSHTSELLWNGGGMGRLVNVPLFLKEMRPEWKNRVEMAGLQTPCRVDLEIDGEAHQLVVGKRSAKDTDFPLVASVACTQQSFLQMTLGTLDFESIPGVAVGGHKGLLKALFPQSSPHLYSLDGF